MTREEAVLFLLSLQERIDLIVQHSPDEYNAVASGQMRKFHERDRWREREREGEKNIPKSIHTSKYSITIKMK